MSRPDTPYKNGTASDDALPPRAHLYDYLIVIGRYRRLILAIVIGGGLIVAGITLVMPHRYNAAATLLPPDKAEGVSLTSLIQRNTGFDLQAFGENTSAEIFVQMLTSRTLVDSIIDRFDIIGTLKLAPDQRQIAEDYVRGNFDIVADRHGVVTIGYSARTGYFPSKPEQRAAAELSANIVNAAIDILDKLNRQKNVSRARRTREYIGRMKEIKRAELDTAQRSLLRFQQTNKAIALDKQVEASVSALAEIQTQIQKKEIELNTGLNELSPNAQLVENLRTQLADMQRQKTRLESGQAGGEALGLNLKDIPDLMRQYANHKLDLEVATQVYTYLEAQYNQEQVQEARDLPTVNVLDEAVPPVLRSSPRRGLALIVAIPALTVFSLIVVFIYDSFRRQWRTDDSEKMTELRDAFGRRRKHQQVKTS